MTFKEALDDGYKISETRFFRGYVSRKADSMVRECKVGQGRRKGQLYIELPNFKSTQYSIRAYLTKD